MEGEDMTRGASMSKPINHNVSGVVRCGKSCRVRRINLTIRDFSEDEDDLIIKLHALLGNRWSLIAGRLPGRTDDQVRNHWNSHLKRKLTNMGMDPSNHRLNQHHHHHCFLGRDSAESSASDSTGNSGRVILPDLNVDPYEHS